MGTHGAEGAEGIRDAGAEVRVSFYDRRFE